MEQEQIGRNLKLNDCQIPYIIQYNKGLHPTRHSNYTQTIMSTIRAKQEICLNICTIRAFTAYSPGRYCLRFCLWETYSNSSTSSDYPSEHRYAIPVSVIQYKSNSSSASPANSPQYEISDYYYQTKPFMLKSGLEVPIQQICVFKHDINIFNSKYESDYHDLTMKCKCELIAYDYTGEEGRVVSTFNGRIRGVGISDSVVIDFWEGISCQVVGTVHNCVYQFQYVYTGQSGRTDSVMKDSINIENINQMMRYTSDTKNYTNRSSDSETMNFEKYCQLQSKQYVESLLEYLLAEVHKSDEKISVSLEVFDKISDKSSQNKNQFELSPQHEQQYSMELQRSIRNQSQLEADSIIDSEMKQRLSIFKAESKYYCPSDQDEGNVQIFVEDEDSDDMNPRKPEQQKEQSKNKGTIGKNQKIKMKSQQDEQDYVCIVLQSDQQEVQQKNNVNDGRYKSFQYNPQGANGDSRANKKKQRIFGINIREQGGNQKVERDLIVKTENIVTGTDLEQKTKITRRRKIFVHSHTNKSEQKMINHPLPTQLEQVQLFNKSSVYEARFVPPSTGTNSHPNNQPAKVQALSTSTSKVTIEQFEKLLHANCLTIYEKWRKFVAFLAQPQGILLVNAYKLEYRKKLEALLGQSIIRFKGSLDIDIYSKEQSQRNKMAYQIRSQVPENEKNIRINEFRFYNKNLFSTKKPIFFEEKFEQIPPNQLQNQAKHTTKKSFIKVSLSSNHGNQSEAHHIVFLVHGLGACRLDMDRLKVEIKRNFKQKVHVVCSCSNEGRTQGSIDLMGVRLGHEVEQEIARNFGSYDSLHNRGLKISFIGHSMGGIIIRSALPRLEKFKNYFHSFVTLSSPHLGYCYSSSKLIDVGLWLINNWQKCESILQLTMSDVSKNNPKARFNLEDTFLYKLSLQKGLEWFKKVTFLASRQDLYVPYFSARVQKHEQCMSDLKYKNQYAIAHSKMVDNMLGRVTGNVTRIDVNFCITQQNIDNLIGRAAHINFVNSVQFLQLLCLADEGTLI